MLIDNAHEPAQPLPGAKPPAVRVRHVQGDLLEQPVEALANAWNRNYMPRWLLVPHGVSGALRSAPAPDPGLARRGLLRHGAAVVTDAVWQRIHRRTRLAA